MAIGWFLSDAWDATGGRVVDAASSAWDAAKDAVPGLREVADAIDSAVSGPVRDFARSGVGRTMFQALAGSLTGGLAPLVGPQLATVAFALPGLAKGDDFVTAWTQEFSRRVDELAKTQGLDGALGFLDAMAKLREGLTAAGIDGDAIADLADRVDFRALARQYGVPDEAAAMVLSLAKGATLDMFLPFVFDKTTGAAVLPASASRTTKAGARTTWSGAAAFARKPVAVASSMRSAGVRAVAAPPPVAPAPISAARPSTPTTSSDVALGLAIAAAAGAAWWWYQGRR